MAKYPFTDKELRRAARIYAEKMTAALEEELEGDSFKPSPGFQGKIESIQSYANATISRKQKRRKTIAAACLAFLLLITAFFSINTTARAGVQRWIKDVYKDFIVYLFSGEKSDSNLPKISAEWLPDDLTLTEQEENNDDHCSYMYVNADGSKGVIISCDKTSSGSSLSVSDLDDDREHYTASLAGYEVDCFVSDHDTSDYVWYDNQGWFCFTLTSNLPHEINMKIIENLKIEMN